MTFLELCKAVRQECGIQGENVPVSVIAQTGILQRVVGWVKDADLLIQTAHPDWDFLWKTFKEDTVKNSDGIAKPADFGMWDRTAFAVNRGTTSGRSLTYTPYREWRKNNYLKTSAEPSLITILPDNSLALFVPANDTYEIYGEYWAQPTPLTINDQNPLIPIRFQRAIIARAKMWFFEDIESFNQFQLAEKEFNYWLGELESFALPEQQEGNQSSPDNMIVRSV